MTTPDPRTIFGKNCEWWDEADQTTPRTACPHCGKPLVDYRKFTEWQRGRCFPSITEAQDAYAKSLVAL